MTTIVSLTQTCYACPSQWDGLTDDGREVYIRYRWGHLEITAAAPGDTEPYAAVRGESIFSADLGDDLDGTLSQGDLIEATGDAINWRLA